MYGVMMLLFHLLAQTLICMTAELELMEFLVKIMQLGTIENFDEESTHVSFFIITITKWDLNEHFLA
jgi:hypothetical protein